MVPGHHASVHVCICASMYMPKGLQPGSICLWTGLLETLPKGGESVQTLGVVGGLGGWQRKAQSCPDASFSCAAPACQRQCGSLAQIRAQVTPWEQHELLPALCSGLLGDAEPGWALSGEGCIFPCMPMERNSRKRSVEFHGDGFMKAFGGQGKKIAKVSFNCQTEFIHFKCRLSPGPQAGVKEKVKLAELVWCV